MRELGLVTTQVLAVLRPQIQEAASAPQLVAGRLLQGESRLHAGRESTAPPTQHSLSSSCVGAQVTGTSETLTLPSWDSANLGWVGGAVHTCAQQPHLIGLQFTGQGLVQSQDLEEQQQPTICSKDPPL